MGTGLISRQSPIICEEAFLGRWYAAYCHESCPSSPFDPTCLVANHVGPEVVNKPRPSFW